MTVPEVKLRRAAGRGLARHGARRLRLAALAACAAVVLIGAALVPSAAGAADGREWQHSLWTAAQLRAERPSVPVVVLLGGSAAREAVVNDVSWAADVRRLGGRPVETYDLGSRLRTFEQDVALVKALPRIPLIVYIGINAGRFASPFTTTTDTTPPKAKPSWVRHHYRSTRIWTPERKQERVRYWLDHRQEVFDERYPRHLADLDRLIATCVRRGYTTVVLALPRNLVAMGHALDAPVDRYLRDGRRLARRHGAGFVDFVPELRLADDEFYDLDHLVGSGREAYQARLALETVRLLGPEPAGAAPAGMESPAATADTVPETWLGGARTLLPLASAFVLLGVAVAVLRRRTAIRR
ncbi:MAG: hypothetical protein ACM3MJ_00845, partial [Deltaproteobacteria bacterium]